MYSNEIACDNNIKICCSQNTSPDFSQKY